MKSATLEGNRDDGYSPKEIADGIDDLNRHANNGHELGGLALTNVAIGIMGPEATVYGRNRVVMPTGYLAVSRSLPRFDTPQVAPGTDNFLG